jgi:cytochrome b
MNKPAKSTVWDLPTRIFHWLLVILVGIAWYMAEFSSSIDNREWHARAGYGVLALLVFRIIWGFIGGRHARFTDFVRGPGAIIAYLRGKTGDGTREPRGHNPLGALSVLALLALLAFQTITGLFGNDDILYEGPLFHLVSKETSDYLVGLHHLGWNILQVLILLHIAAVIFYLLVKKTNLILPMITGRKPGSDTAQDGPPASGSLPLAIVLLVLSGLAVWVIVTYL